MKNIVRAAAAAAAFLLSSTGSAAFAANVQPVAASGHFEWRSQPNFGPRSPIRPPLRVWVAESEAMSAGSCAMMSGVGVADCMAMPTQQKPASQG